MNKLNIETAQNLSTEKYSNLVGICKTGLEKIADQGPSDNDVKLSLKKMDKGFIATIKMVSLGLVFTLHATAQSPYMAVELVMKEALGKVHKWSATR